MISGITGPAGLTAEDIRLVVRDEVRKAFAKEPAARTAAVVASKGDRAHVTMFI